MAYIRTNIYITRAQKAAFKQLGKVKDIKPAELVRRALDEYLAKEATHAR